MLKYWYDLANDVTWVTGPGFRDSWPGKVEHLVIHEHYGTLVFEIMPSEEIIALPTNEEETGKDSHAT